MENMYNENENIIQRHKKEIDEKNKIISLHENNIRTLKLDINEKNNFITKLKEENEEKERKLSRKRFQLIICFIIIVFLIFLSVFFKLSESKLEVIEEINSQESIPVALIDVDKNEKDEEIIKTKVSISKEIIPAIPVFPTIKKEEVQPIEAIKTKVSISKEIIPAIPVFPTIKKEEVQPIEAIKTKVSVPKETVPAIPALPTTKKEEVQPVETIKTESIKTNGITSSKPKKLIYSEDEVYTNLIWKGYRGERAIYEFQKDNGMPQTGKIDERLLKKLGIKPKYK